jgi:hypothetical protein
MKLNSETENVIAGNPSASGHYNPGHWFLNHCGELSQLRMQQRRRELTHFNPGHAAIAGEGMVSRS